MEVSILEGLYSCARAGGNVDGDINAPEACVHEGRLPKESLGLGVIFVHCDCRGRPWLKQNL
jgi:hypothetical protein